MRLHGCVHVTCDAWCRLDALGPELPRFMRDRDGRVWSRFGDIWYLYAGSSHVGGEILDSSTWMWFQREHGPLQAVDALGQPFTPPTTASSV